MPYEIIGSDLYDIESGEYVGALNLPRMNLSRPAGRGAALTPAMISAALARRPMLLPQAMPVGPRVVPTAPSRVDETPLPITATSVAAGASSDISTNAQIVFSPRRLIIPESIAPFFTVDAFNVGNVPLFAGTGSIPAEAFRPDSVNPNVRKVTAQPGVAIVVRVTNVDAVAHTFRAAVFGEGAQPSGC